jgi:plastocyanin
VLCVVLVFCLHFHSSPFRGATPDDTSSVRLNLDPQTRYYYFFFQHHNCRIAMTKHRTWITARTVAASAFLALGLAQFTTSDAASMVSPLSVGPRDVTTPAILSTTETTGIATGALDTPRIHLVKAGLGSFQFEPDVLSNVSVGDIVTFEFYPPDHSVARAEFGSACMPYEYTGKNKIGFWSETQWVETTNDVSDCFVQSAWKYADSSY